MSDTGTVQAGEVEITRDQLLGQIAEIDGNAPASDTASTPTSDNAAEEPTSETVNVEDKAKELEQDLVFSQTDGLSDA